MLETEKCLQCNLPMKTWVIGPEWQCVKNVRKDLCREYERKEKESEVAQSSPTPWDPMDSSLPESSIHGIFQARILECIWNCYQTNQIHVPAHSKANLLTLGCVEGKCSCGDGSVPKSPGELVLKKIWTHKWTPGKHFYRSGEGGRLQDVWSVPGTSLWLVDGEVSGQCHRG